jgi:hypothetical protein
MRPAIHSYDTLAEEYAQRIAGDLKDKLLDRALLTAFAEMVRGWGTVADVPRDHLVSSECVDLGAGPGSHEGTSGSPQ